jgi:hypothetical protein
MLLRLIKAYNRGKVSASVVSDYLAGLCCHAHQHTKDGTVGPSCIVVWRNSKESRYKGGGRHSCYEGTKRVGEAMLPTIVLGMDVSAITKLISDLYVPRLFEHIEAIKRGGDAQPPELPEEDFNERLSKLPHGPDEKLR